jgi:hypothetical protein
LSVHTCISQCCTCENKTLKDININILFEVGDLPNVNVTIRRDDGLNIQAKYDIREKVLNGF